jgi:hypothetical protein
MINKKPGVVPDHILSLGPVKPCCRLISPDHRSRRSSASYFAWWKESLAGRRNNDETRIAGRGMGKNAGVQEREAQEKEKGTGFFAGCFGTVA